MTIQPAEKHNGLRPAHGVVLVGTVVVAAIVAYAAFGFIAGVIAFVVKLAIVVAIVGLVAKLVLRRARS